MKLRLSFAHTALIGALTIFGNAHAQTVVSSWTDGFSGSSGSALSTKTTTTGTPTLTWNATSTFKADGSTTGVGSAWLPITIEDGHVYTLTVDVDSSALPKDNTTGRFAGIAFTTNYNNIDGISGTSPHYAALVLRNYNNVDVLNPGTFYNASAQVGNNFGTGASIPVSSPTQTLTLILDTTGNEWKYEASIGFNSIIGTLTKQTVNGFGLISNAAGAEFSNLTFTVATTTIPEPASALPISLGAACICFAHRLRRKRFRSQTEI